MFDPRRVFESLSDMEQDQVEAEAAAFGVSIEEMMVIVLRDGLRAVAAGELDMDEVFQPTDSQWKSH